LAGVAFLAERAVACQLRQKDSNTSLAADGTLARPGHVLVYDFVVTPDEINPDAAVAIDAKRETHAFQWVSVSKRISSSGALMIIMKTSGEEHYGLGKRCTSE
jgi:hypothetical protein